MYKLLIRPLLFLFDPESVHHFTFTVLRILHFIPGIGTLLRARYDVRDERLTKEVMGLTFSNPVGLAAGFDKDAKLVDELACLGFGFIEIGTLTPKPQAGNDKPRLFRLPEDQGIINRMGFNNGGVAEAVKRLRRRTSNVIIGGNIGKNKTTDNALAVNDYTYCFEALYDVVDYFVVNVSSPNTPNLRALQEKEPLQRLLEDIRTRNAAKSHPKPILLKIAPDLSNEQLDDIVDIVKETGIAGLIATNTTLSREGLRAPAERVKAIGPGGLSGAPLQKRATEIIRYLRGQLGPKACIIGVGGIFTGKDAKEKLDAGASLVQVYSGFVYEGPSMIKKLNKHLIN